MYGTNFCWVPWFTTLSMPWEPDIGDNTWVVCCDSSTAIVQKYWQAIITADYGAHPNTIYGFGCDVWRPDNQIPTSSINIKRFGKSSVMYMETALGTFVEGASGNYYYVYEGTR